MAAGSDLSPCKCKQSFHTRCLTFVYLSLCRLGKYFTRTLKTAESQPVIDAGPYSIVRHPGYLGNLIVFLGYTILMTQSVSALLVISVVYAIIWRSRIANEERMLVRELGLPYERYMRRTWRLIPFVY